MFVLFALETLYQAKDISKMILSTEEEEIAAV